VSTQQFAPGTRFLWQETHYEVKRILQGGKINIENMLTEAYRTVEVATLADALFSGALQFETKGKLGKTTTTAREGDVLSTEVSYISLDECPPPLVELARRRLHVIEPLVTIPPTERTLAQVKARVAEIRAASQSGSFETAGQGNSPADSEQFRVSVPTVYRWLKDYEESGCDLRALVPSSQRSGAPRRPRIEEAANNIVESVIRERYLVRERVTVDDVLREVAVRIEEINRSLTEAERLNTPSRATVGRRLEAYLMTEELNSYALRHGKAAAERRFTQFGQSKRPSMPLERAEIDHTTSDFMVVDDNDNLPMGRLNFTYMVDAYTEYPLGLHIGFEPPSSRSVMDCLYNAICPKRNIRERYNTKHDWLAYGVPHSLVVDNAKQFRGRDLKEACEQLSIQLYFTPVRKAWFKGIVEREFNSFNTMLFHTLPGTTFSNVSRRSDYDSVKEACVSLNDIDQLIHKFLVDFYAERFSKGIRAIPARAWERAIAAGFLPRLPASLEELRIILSRVEQRTVAHYGIELWGLRYNCAALAPLRSRLERQKDRSLKVVKVKYHPGDVSRIYVYDHFDQHYIEVPALGQEYTADLSLWKHRVILRVARSREDKPDIVALGETKRELQRIVADARTRTRAKVKSRSRMARWETNGKSVEELAQRDDELTNQAHTSHVGSSLEAPAMPQPPTAAKARTQLPLPLSAVAANNSSGVMDSNDTTSSSSGWSVEVGSLPRTLHRVSHNERKGNTDEC
jgi:putative transposase